MRLKIKSILMIYLMILLPFYISSVFAAESNLIAKSVNGENNSYSSFARITPISQGKNIGIADQRVELLLTISDVNTKDVDDNNAAIEWNTDNESDSRVSYGKTTALGLIKSDYNLTARHDVMLANLEGGTLYYFSIISSDGIDTVTDDNNGEFYTFTTTIDTTAPYIIAGIPSLYNSYEIDISGEVEPNSQVKLFLNGAAVRVLDHSETDDGLFSFNNVRLQTENTIRIHATDLSGNENYTDYEIRVDAEAPVLEIEEISGTTFSENLSIRGNVNEQATINIYLTRTSEDTIAPEKVSGLNILDTGSNLIEFEWDINEEPDMDYYIIYRDDIGIIATNPASYNRLLDVRVNTSTQYSYQVSAVDENGNEGEKSDPLVVTTLDGGSTNVIMPPALELEERVETMLVEQLNTTGAFSVDLRLDRGDGIYYIKIEAKDIAGNAVIVEENIVLDTTPPDIRITSPRGHTRIYENYADDVTIEGETDPYADVHLWVQRTPLGGYLNRSFEVAGLLNDVEELDESRLSADCRLEIAGEEYCDTGADFSTTADANGYFRFEHIDLTSIFGGAIDAVMVPPGDRYVNEYMNRHYNRFGQFVVPLESDLLFVATDYSGQRAAQIVSYDIVTCWSGNMTYDIIPNNAYQSPTFLSTERIAEGTEAIYFLVNFTYRGYGTNDIINSVSFSKACDDYIQQSDPKYNVSCEIMPSSCIAKYNEDRTMWYVACHLAPYKAFDRFLKDDWEDFMDSISNEMIFPFQIRISYTHEIDGDISSEVQTMCEPITYVVDNSKINFKDVLPDWLLYDAVDWLEDTIEVIDDVMEKVYEVLEYLAIGCVASFVIKFVLTVSRRFSCYWNGFQDSIGKIVDKQDGAEQCPFGRVGFGWETEQNKLTNKELEVDCPSCASAWKLEAKLYTTYRWLCDRVFCHAAPARWTQDKSDIELEQKAIEEVNQCGAVEDKALFGQVLIEAKCSGFKAEDLSTDVINEHRAGNRCYRASVKRGATVERLVFVKAKDQPKASEGYYEFIVVSSYSSTIGLKGHIWAKEIGDRYYTARAETCSEWCKQQGYSAYSCGKSQACTDLGSNVGGDDKDIAARGNASAKLGLKAVPGKTFNFGPINKYNTRRYGYTSDCVFGNKVEGAVEIAPIQTGYTSSETDECCCVGGGTPTEPGESYKADDQGSSKWCGENERKGTELCEVFEKAEAGTEYPQFDYRYNHIKYQTAEGHSQYNPNRYVAGRDQPACFGLNSFLMGGNRLRNDPHKSHIAAFQCACISGIYNRLQAIRNILVALRGCLIQVRTTGTADAGACKELFSQWVCGLFWKVIVMMKDGCMPWDSWGKDEANLSEMKAFMQGGTQALVGGLSESMNELAEEYGGTVATNLLGVDEEAVARKVCLAAFGYDWEISMEDVVDVAYQTPFATLVMPVLPFREYLTFDPFNGWSSYEYRSAWLINPGCDFDDYDVYLSCVSANEIYSDEYPGIDCTEQGDPEGSNCDCMGLDKEVVRKFYDGRRLDQNVLEDTDYQEVISAPFIYDHLKFVLRPRRDISDDIVANCFPEDHEKDGVGVFYFPIKDRTARDIVACQVEPTNGIFQCISGEAFWGAKGNAYIESVELQGGGDIIEAREREVNEGFFSGSVLYVTPTVWKSTDRDQCLRITLQGASGVEEDEEFIGIDVDGIHEYSPINIKELVIGSSQVTETSGKVTINPITTNNAEDIGPWGFTFTDVDGDHIFRISDDSTDTIKIVGEGLDYKQSTPIPIREYLEKINNTRLILTGKDKRGGRVELEILSVAIPTRETDGAIESEVVDGKIYIRNPADAGSYEDKKVILQLFHLKDKGEQQYYSSPDDCNLNDPIQYQNDIQKKAYTIKVKAIRPAAADNCVDGSPTSLREADKCKCGGSAEKNCPNGDNTYCYGVCRQYKPCRVSSTSQISLTSQCVCDSSTPADKFDCGADNSYIDEDNIKNRGGWYCYGNKCQEEAPAIIQEDTIPPDIRSFKINNYVENIRISEGSNMAIAVVTEDSDSGVELVTVYVDNIPSFNIIEAEPSDTYSYTWEDPENGDYSIYVVVKDNAGLETKSETLEVRVGIAGD